MGDEATGRGDGSATVSEGIDQAGLEAWFAAHAGEVEPPLEFERIAGGLSNLTFRVTDGAGRRWVLRRRKQIPEKPRRSCTPGMT